MSLIRKHGAVLQAWACLDLVLSIISCHSRWSICGHCGKDKIVFCSLFTGIVLGKFFLLIAIAHLFLYAFFYLFPRIVIDSVVFHVFRQHSKSQKG